MGRGRFFCFKIRSSCRHRILLGSGGPGHKVVSGFPRLAPPRGGKPTLRRGQREHVWPTVANRDVIGVNQAWAGSPGFRIDATPQSQTWAKPLGASHDSAALATAKSGTIENIDINAVQPWLLV